MPRESKSIFITGTGTDVGKTVVSAILAEAFSADYWKPIQAGHLPYTDSEWVKDVLSNSRSLVHKEAYTLRQAASPHIASRNEEVIICSEILLNCMPATSNLLIIEGAGGLMVPLASEFFVADLPLLFGAEIILISRNILGSINHSLLTAAVCKQKKLPVVGWIFNGESLGYEQEISEWSGYPWLSSIPFCDSPDKKFVTEQAVLIRERSKSWIW